MSQYLIDKIVRCQTYSELDEIFDSYSVDFILGTIHKDAAVFDSLKKFGRSGKTKIALAIYCADTDKEDVLKSLDLATLKYNEMLEIVTKHPKIGRSLTTLAFYTMSESVELIKLCPHLMGVVDHTRFSNSNWAELLATYPAFSVFYTTAKSDRVLFG